MMMRFLMLCSMPIMNNSYTLWLALHKLDLLKDSPEYWWPQCGSFEVLVGAILTQQTKWQNVEKSLKNLKDAQNLSLESLRDTPIMILESLIKPSGYYRKKAKVLQTLCEAIVEDFGDFETFQTSVSRAWLLAQKGIGFESADAILCYACKRDVMVIDNYTNKMMQGFGYTFESYDDLQEWMMRGIEEHYSEISKLYKADVSFFTVYSQFHGKIVEYAKENGSDASLISEYIS